MKRRLLSGIAVLLLLASMALPLALATETTEETTEATEETTKRLDTSTSGSCGKNASWRLEGHTLTITGSGALDDGCPWEFYKDTIEVLMIRGEITAIGAGNFASCNNLKYIDFGSSLKEIGYQAFFSCNALEAVRLPATFRKFGQECFKDCDGLQVVYCDGPMPSFKGNCMYTNHTVSIYYSKETPWPWEEVDRLHSNFGARIYVQMGDPDVLDDYWYNFPTRSYAEEETVPETTVPETTVPETTLPVVVTVPETTVPETTIPETTAPSTEEVVFELESEPLFVTEPEHKPAEKEESEKPLSGITRWFWVIVAAAIVTGLLILAIVARMVINGIRGYED